ncbi:MAG TPA: hypothetical protein VII63_09520 [Caulobacteraceae bacterium]
MVRTVHSGFVGVVSVIAIGLGMIGCQPAGGDAAASRKALSAAAHKAADQFVAMAKGSEQTGRAPRQTEAAVAPMLNAVFDTSALDGKPTPRFSEVDPMNEWMLSAARVGQVYLFAGTGVTDPTKAADPRVEAQAERNVVTYAPEVGRYIDAELRLVSVLDAMVAQDLAAHPEKTNDPKKAHGLSDIRSGTTTTINSALVTLATQGLTDDWRLARMPALLGIAPDAARLLNPDEKASLRKTALAVGDSMSDANLKIKLSSFADAVAPAAAPAPT